MGLYDVSFLDGYGINHRLYEAGSIEELRDYLKDSDIADDVVAITDRTSGDVYVELRGCPV